MKKLSLWFASFLLLCLAVVPLAKAQSQVPVRYVVFHKPGPGWLPGVDFREQPGVQEHVKHYLKLSQDGKLAMGGPFLDNSGGMMIPTADVTFEDIKAFAESDPAVKSGLLIVEIKPWMVVMEK